MPGVFTCSLACLGPSSFGLARYELGVSSVITDSRPIRPCHILGSIFAAREEDSLVNARAEVMTPSLEMTQTVVSPRPSRPVHDTVISDDFVDPACIDAESEDVLEAGIVVYRSSGW